MRLGEIVNRGVKCGLVYVGPDLRQGDDIRVSDDVHNKDKKTVLLGWVSKAVFGVK